MNIFRREDNTSKCKVQSRKNDGTSISPPRDGEKENVQ